MTQPIDARGKSCPLPIVLLAKAMRDVANGEERVIIANDRAFPADVQAWCRKTGNTLVGMVDEAGVFKATVRKVS